MVGAAVGIYVGKTFGRRSILLLGHMTMCLLLFGTALATMYSWATAQLVLVLAFIFINTTTSGPITFVYATEICSDAALSVVIFIYYFWTTF